MSFQFRALLLLLAAFGSCFAQNSTQDTDSQIEVLRADMRASKTDLISQAMDFNEKESKVFWPVYKQYESEIAALNDQRLAIVKEYAAKYSTMTDKDAKDLLDRSLEFEGQLTELKKHYADEFQERGLPSITTAKFFQFEHRLDTLVDLQLASELPMVAKHPMKAKAKAAPKQ